MATEYKEISRAESFKLPAERYTHAAHVLVYAPWTTKLFGKYDCKYHVMVCHEKHTVR